MTNTNGQPETFCGITTAEDGLALAAKSAAETWNRGNKRSVSVMVDNGVSGHSFYNCRFTGSRYKLENYQELAIRRWITTAGGHQLKGAGQGLLRGHSIGTQGLKSLTQLSVLAGPDIGRDFFSVEQDGALPGGESLAVNHGSNLHHLGKRLQIGEFRKVVPSNILSSQCRLAVNTWRHHSQDHCHSNTMDLRATKGRHRRRGQATQRSP